MLKKKSGIKVKSRLLIKAGSGGATTDDPYEEELEDVLQQIAELINFDDPFSVNRLTRRLYELGIISPRTAVQICQICRGVDEEAAD